MQITAIKTPIVRVGDTVENILSAVTHITDQSIVVVTSKIVSICQRRVESTNGANKNALIREEAEYYLDSALNARYHVTLTIKDNIIIANSGIDESNGDGTYVLWPKDSFGVAAGIWTYLRKKHNLKHLGVLVTDTRTTPMRWGTIGVALSWCGFEPLKNYIGQPDIFGHKLRMTKASVIDGLAATADLVMGQGNEQTPLAVIEDVPFVEFTDQPPSARDIDAMKIDIQDDLYAPILTSVRWKKGYRS